MSPSQLQGLSDGQASYRRHKDDQRRKLLQRIRDLQREAMEIMKEAVANESYSTVFIAKLGQVHLAANDAAEAAEDNSITTTFFT